MFALAGESWHNILSDGKQSEGDEENQPGRSVIWFLSTVVVCLSKNNSCEEGIVHVCLTFAMDVCQHLEGIDGGFCPEINCFLWAKRCPFVSHGVWALHSAG